MTSDLDLHGNFNFMNKFSKFLELEGVGISGPTM